MNAIPSLCVSKTNTGYFTLMFGTAEQVEEFSGQRMEMRSFRVYKDGHIKLVIGPSSTASRRTSSAFLVPHQGPEGRVMLRFHQAKKFPDIKKVRPFRSTECNWTVINGRIEVIIPALRSTITVQEELPLREIGTDEQFVRAAAQQTLERVARDEAQPGSMLDYLAQSQPDVSAEDLLRLNVTRINALVSQMEHVELFVEENRLKARLITTIG
jgi:hypothetical protein